MRWLLMVALACGCTQTPADELDTLCTTFCDCELPTGTAECVTACEAQVQTVPMGCITCVYDHDSSCDALEADCQQMCFSGGIND